MQDNRTPHQPAIMAINGMHCSSARCHFQDRVACDRSNHLPSSAVDLLISPVECCLL